MIALESGQEFLIVDRGIDGENCEEHYFSDPVTLLALENGGRALLCNDEHFGSMHNLNAPGRGVNMGDGWETARRRGPGNDWVILALGFPSHRTRERWQGVTL